MRDPDRRFAADTIAAIGLCAKRNPQVANTCLEGLLALTSPSKSPTLFMYGILSTFFDFVLNIYNACRSYK